MCGAGQAAGGRRAGGRDSDLEMDEVEVEISCSGDGGDAAAGVSAASGFRVVHNTDACSSGGHGAPAGAGHAGGDSAQTWSYLKCCCFKRLRQGKSSRERARQSSRQAC